jgi:hypothetical protein
MENALPASTCLGRFMLALWARVGGIAVRATLPTKHQSRNLIENHPNCRQP